MVYSIKNHHWGYKPQINKKNNLKIISISFDNSKQGIVKHRYRQIPLMFYCLVNRLGYIEGFVQDRSNSIANALEPLQSHTRPSIWPTHVQVILCFYPHNTHCQFNMFYHWLYTYPPQFKWRDWNRKGFIYPCGYQNYKYQFTHGSQHDTQWNICAYYYIYLSNKQKNRVMWLVRVQGTDLI